MRTTKKFTCNPNIIDDKLKLSLLLRSIYADAGYKYYKSNKFESYDFYREHRDFLLCDNILTFTDTNGSLMSLNPDMTLSIIKSPFLVHNSVNKVYYDEDVYRISNFTGRYKCYRQLGLECFGDIDDGSIYEVFMLAISSLSALSSNFIIAFSHTQILEKVLKTMRIKDAEFIKFVKSKNTDAIVDYLRLKKVNYNYIDTFLLLCKTYSLSSKDVEKDIKNILSFFIDIDDFSYILDLIKRLKKTDYSKNIQLDFSLAAEMNYSGNFNYYSGLYFNGFIPSLGEKVLSGGQYDNILQKMGKSGRAIGFAVYIDRLRGLLC